MSEKMTREEWNVLSADVYLEIRRQEYIKEHGAPLASPVIEEPYYAHRVNAALQFRAMLHEYHNRERGSREAPPSTTPTPKQISHAELLAQFIKAVCNQLSPANVSRLTREVKRIVDEEVAKMTADNKLKPDIPPICENCDRLRFTSNIPSCYGDPLGNKLKKECETCAFLPGCEYETTKPKVLRPAESLIGKTPEELGLKGPACAEKNRDQPDGYYAEGRSIFLKTTIGGQPCFTEVAKCRGEKAAAELISAIKGGAK